MATIKWGKVYYKDHYAGRLQEEPGGRIIFTYDVSYLKEKLPTLAHTLPLCSEPFISESGLLPFFDNLVAEGWLCRAQAKALNIRPENHFSLLLGFGYDIAGAVSIIDPTATNQLEFSNPQDDPILNAALTNRASISGIQRKLLLVKEGKAFRPAEANELSTHIAKLASGNLHHLLELEYLTTIAVRQLLPHDYGGSYEAIG